MHTTIVRKPVYVHGRLTGYELVTYAPTTPQAVSLDAIKGLLKTALDARDRAVDARLVVASQQAADRAERTQLVAHLAAHGWTEQDGAGMPLATLRKVVRAVVFGAAEAADAALPNDCPSWK